MSSSSEQLEQSQAQSEKLVDIVGDGSQVKKQEANMVIVRVKKQPSISLDQRKKGIAMQSGIKDPSGKAGMKQAGGGLQNELRQSYGGHPTIADNSKNAGNFSGNTKNSKKFIKNMITNNFKSDNQGEIRDPLKQKKYGVPEQLKPNTASTQNSKIDGTNKINHQLGDENSSDNPFSAASPKPFKIDQRLNFGQSPWKKPAFQQDSEIFKTPPRKKLAKLSLWEAPTLVKSEKILPDINMTAAQKDKLSKNANSPDGGDIQISPAQVLLNEPAQKKVRSVSHKIQQYDRSNLVQPYLKDPKIPFRNKSAKLQQNGEINTPSPVTVKRQSPMKQISDDLNTTIFSMNPNIHSSGIAYPYVSEFKLKSQRPPSGPPFEISHRDSNTNAVSLSFYLKRDGITNKSDGLSKPTSVKECYPGNEVLSKEFISREIVCATEGEELQQAVTKPKIAKQFWNAFRSGTERIEGKGDDGDRSVSYMNNNNKDSLPAQLKRLHHALAMEQQQLNTPIKLIHQQQPHTSPSGSVRQSNMEANASSSPGKIQKKSQLDLVSHSFWIDESPEQEEESKQNRNIVIYPSDQKKSQGKHGQSEKIPQMFPVVFAGKNRKVMSDGGHTVDVEVSENERLGMRALTQPHRRTATTKCTSSISTETRETKILSDQRKAVQKQNEQQQKGQQTAQAVNVQIDVLKAEKDDYDAVVNEDQLENKNKQRDSVTSKEISEKNKIANNEQQQQRKEQGSILPYAEMRNTMYNKKLANSSIRFQVLGGGETIQAEGFAVMNSPSAHPQKSSESIEENGGELEDDDGIIRINIKNVLEIESYLDEICIQISKSSLEYLPAAEKFIALIYEDPQFSINQAYVRKGGTHNIRFFNDERLCKVGKVLNVLELVSVHVIAGLGKTKKPALRSFFPQMANLMKVVHSSFLMYWDLQYHLLSENITDKDCLSRLRERIEDQRQVRLGRKKASYLQLKQSFDLISNTIKPLIKALKDVSFELGSFFQVCEEQPTKNNEQSQEILQQSTKQQQSNDAEQTLQQAQPRGRVSNIKPFLPPQQDSSSKQLTLVLDLDETLIHFFETRSGGSFLTRPFCEKFLREMSKLYELVIFTAGTEDYANWVLDILDKQKYITYRLYRQHTLFRYGVYVKDLSKIGRDLNTTIIIDNVPENFRMQKANGIAIKSWYNDRSDTAFKELIPLLTELAQNQASTQDIRVSLKSMKPKYPYSKTKGQFELPG